MKITANKKLIINGKKILIKSLSHIKEVFELYKDTEFLDCSLSENDEKSIIVLFNRTHSLGIFLRYNGDSGFTTCNSYGNENKIQKFLLANGQIDEYKETMLVKREIGFEVLKYFTLTSEMYPKIEWKEE